MNFVDQQVQGANVAYYCSLVVHVGALGSQLSDATACTVNLVKLATDKTLVLLLQVTSIKGFPHSVATSSPLPVAGFTKLTVPDLWEVSLEPGKYPGKVKITGKG